MNLIKNINSTRNQLRILIFVFCTFFPSISLQAQKSTVNVNGTWKMSVETSVGNGSPTFALKQAVDDTILGTYKGQLGEASVKGTLKGTAIHLEFSISSNLVEYDGVVDNDSMKGTVKLGSMGSGSFTGNKTK
jgi:hypothetical protein